MGKIIGLVGKKSSGKSTTANWIIGQQMVAVGLVDYIKIDKLGRLVVPAMDGDVLKEGIFDVTSKNPEIVAMLKEYVWPVVKTYSFADILKESLSKIFSIEMYKLNGTDEDKNGPTQYTYAQWMPFMNAADKREVKEQLLRDKPISGRKLMQIFGTDICRSIYKGVWVNACLNKIKEDNPDLAIITDVRFPDELNAIKEAGGKTIKFTRAPFADVDTHESETALDNVPFTEYDCVMDNKDSTIQQQNELTNAQLLAWGYNTWEFRIKE